MGRNRNISSTVAPKSAIRSNYSLIYIDTCQVHVPIIVSQRTGFDHTRHFTCSYPKYGGLDWCFTLKGFSHERAGSPFRICPAVWAVRQPVIKQLVDMLEQIQLFYPVFQATST